MFLPFLKFFLYILFIISSLFAICVLRFYLYFSQPDNEIVCNDLKTHKFINYSNVLVDHFTQAIQFKTITTNAFEYNSSELIRFADWIQKTYPSLHKAKFVKLEKIAKYSLLYTIQGTDKNLKPYLLCSHLDVVPVDADKWTHNSFGGEVNNGYLYGRGTIDFKNGVISILESLEYLIKVEKFVPKRTILVAFGHDEEGAGHEGAAEISKVLQKRYKNLEYILDEGSFIMEKSFLGINRPIAFISVTEKGYVTVKLSARSEPSHASTPTYETAINKIAKAITKFNSNSFPSMFGKGPEVKILEILSSHAYFPYNYIYSNVWLFGPIIDFYFSKNKLSNSLIRTTSAVTMISGGVKENILPTKVEAFINHRVHPLQTIEQVLEFDKKLINDKEIDVSIKDLGFDAHPISPYDRNTFGYNAIRKSINEIFKNVLTVPFLMLASTDTKHYLPLSKNIYRFSPSILDENEIFRFHGNDERIKVENYFLSINFYCHIILASDKSYIVKKNILKDEL